MNRKQLLAAGMALVLLCTGLTGCGKSKQKQYEAAQNLFYYGQYSEARKAFRALEDYSDSKAMITACDYQLAMAQLSDGEYMGASTAFAALGEYGNARGLSRAAARLAALEQYEAGDREDALAGLAGTQLAEDLEFLQDGQDDLSGVTGTWSCTLDVLPEVKSKLTELAQDQDKLDSSFPEKIELKDLNVKVTLEISSDGLAVLNLSQEEMDRMTQSYAAQLHQGVTSYYDTVVDRKTEEAGISREELFENNSVSDAEGLFEAEGGIRFGEFEKRMTPSYYFGTLKALYTGSGIALVNAQSVKLRFPEHSWTVDVPSDGKLTLSDGSNSLTLTKIS